METLEKKVIIELDKLKKHFSSDDNVIQFEKTILEFDELIKIGLIKKRGNNLLSLSEINLIQQVTFNAHKRHNLNVIKFNNYDTII